MLYHLSFLFDEKDFKPLKSGDLAIIPYLASYEILRIMKSMCKNIGDK